MQVKSGRVVMVGAVNLRRGSLRRAVERIVVAERTFVEDLKSKKSIEVRTRNFVELSVESGSCRGRCCHLV
jgi:hypothetical protein